MTEHTKDPCKCDVCVTVLDPVLEDLRKIREDIEATQRALDALILEVKTNGWS